MVQKRLFTIVNSSESPELAIERENQERVLLGTHKSCMPTHTCMRILTQLSVLAFLMFIIRWFYWLVLCLFLIVLLNIVCKNRNNLMVCYLLFSRWNESEEMIHG